MIPKKYITIWFVWDFTGLNKHIVRHLFSLPSIQETIPTMSNFTFCTTLDLNMGYWANPMWPESQRICNIILPWGKFSYTCFPMGLTPSPDVYQEKMSVPFIDLEEVNSNIRTSKTRNVKLPKLQQALWNLHLMHASFQMLKQDIQLLSWNFIPLWKYLENSALSF